MLNPKHILQQTRLVHGPQRLSWVCCIFLVGCLFLAASPKASAQWVRSRRVDARALQSRKFALLIGISRFSNKRWAPLSYAQNDVGKMASMLREHGRFDRIMIRDTPQMTTREALLQSLRDLRRKVKISLDTVVVYVSSHGTISSPPGSPQRQRYIITSDTTERIPQTSLAVKELQEILKTFRSKRIVLILATCYTYAPSSKAVLHAGLKGGDIPTRPLKSRAMQILSAAARSQPAFESAALRSDVYTHFLTDCAKKLLKKKRASITAIDLHVCALAPTREFVKKHQGTNQVPVVYSDRDANHDVVLISPTPASKPMGYFRTVSRRGRGVRYRIVRLGQKSRGAAVVANVDELMALSPGRYRVALEGADGREIELQEIEIQSEQITPWKTDWALDAQGGVTFSPKGGASQMFGGMLGLHHRFVGFKFGVWNAQRTYLSSPSSQQLYLELRLEGGYRHRWAWFELFAGGYAAFGLMMKHVLHPTQEMGMSSVFSYGLTLSPTFWFHPAWGLTLQADAGFAVLRLEEISHLFEFSVRMGLSYRF